MAHKKGQGSTRNGRDSNAQFRGIKLFGGEQARPARSSLGSAEPSSRPATWGQRATATTRLFAARHRVTVRFRGRFVEPSFRRPVDPAVRGTVAESSPAPRGQPQVPRGFDPRGVERVCG